MVSTMMGFRHGFGMMGVFLFICLLVLIALVVLVVRLVTSSTRTAAQALAGHPLRGAAPQPSDALTILDERLARGEIEPQDYQERRRLLAERPGG